MLTFERLDISAKEIRQGHLSSLDSLNIESIFSADGVQRLLRQLEEELAHPRYAGIGSKLQEINALDQYQQERQQHTGDDRPEPQEIRDLWNLYTDQWNALYESSGQETVHDWYVLTGLYEDLGRNLRTPEIGGEPAFYLTSKIVECAPNAHTDRAHFFKSREELDELEPIGVDSNYATFRVPQEYPVDVPISLFVHSEAFESWLGRGGENRSDVEMSAQKVITYSQMLAESAPPVEHSTWYLLPDNRVFIRSGSAHRVAAAIRRGDQTIKVVGPCRVVQVKAENTEREWQQLNYSYFSTRGGFASNSIIFE